MGLTWFRISMLAGLILNLAACQSSVQSMHLKTLHQVFTPSSESAPAYLSCQAAKGCTFAKVDGIVVIDEQTGLPSRQAIEQSMLRLEGSVFSPYQYALALTPEQHEVMVRFHPVSTERSESFHFKHLFMPNQYYQLSMYRQKSGKNGSLLNVAMPGNTCVDLTQNEILIRRFCRPFDVVTGTGEFVEKSV